MSTSPKTRVRLGDLLMRRGVITDEQLAKALDVQQRGQKERLLGEILVDLGYATHEQVLSAVAEGCGVPFARLTPLVVDPAVRNALPEAFLRKHGVLPLFRVRDVLTVAMSEPANLFLVDEIAHVARLSVQIVAATADNIYQMLDEIRPDGAGQPAPSDEAPDACLTGQILVPDDYDSAYGTWPPEKVAMLLIRHAVRSRASAVHLEPDEKVLRVRFQIDGRLHVVMRPPARLAAGLTAALEEIAGVPPGAGASARHSARISVQGRSVQLHLATLQSAFGPRTVVRVVRDEEALRPLEKLGADFELLAAYRETLAAGRGLVVIAGPRGSGVTTTLYGTLNALDPVRLNVCTLEECINFNLPGVNQFSPATCGTPDAAAALERLMLQQPDVLAIDGLLTPAVASVALDAALSGLLVLVQVSATDAADAISRLAAMAPRSRLVAGLGGVLAQRLVRTICPACRTADEPPAGLRRAVAETFGTIESYFRGRGCASCSRTGYVGRIGLFEFVPIGHDLAGRILAGADGDVLRSAIREAGHPSLWVDGVNKVRAGITALDEVMQVLAGCPGGPAATSTPVQRRQPLPDVSRQ